MSKEDLSAQMTSELGSEVTKQNAGETKKESISSRGASPPKHSEALKSIFLGGRRVVFVFVLFFIFHGRLLNDEKVTQEIERHGIQETGPNHVKRCRKTPV